MWKQCGYEEPGKDRTLRCVLEADHQGKHSFIRRSQYPAPWKVDPAIMGYLKAYGVFIVALLVAWLVLGWKFLIRPALMSNSRKIDTDKR